MLSTKKLIFNIFSSLIVLCLLGIWLCYQKITHTEELATVIFTVFIFIFPFTIYNKDPDEAKAIISNEFHKNSNEKKSIGVFKWLLIGMATVPIVIIFYKAYSENTTYQIAGENFFHAHDAGKTFIFYIFAFVLSIILLLIKERYKEYIKEKTKLFFNNIYLSKYEKISFISIFSSNLNIFKSCFDEQAKEYQNNITFKLFVKDGIPIMECIARKSPENIEKERDENKPKAGDQSETKKIFPLGNTLNEKAKINTSYYSDNQKIYNATLVATENKEIDITDKNKLIIEKGESTSSLTIPFNTKKSIDTAIEKLNQIKVDNDLKLEYKINFEVHATVIATDDIVISIDNEKTITIKKGESLGALGVKTNLDNIKEVIKTHLDQSINLKVENAKNFGYVSITATLVATENKEIDIIDNNKIIIEEGESTSRLTFNTKESIDTAIEKLNQIKVDNDLKLEYKINLEVNATVIAADDIVISIDNEKTIIIKKGGTNGNKIVPLTEIENNQIIKKIYELNHELEEQTKLETYFEYTPSKNELKYNSSIVASEKIEIPIDNDLKIEIKKGENSGIIKINKNINYYNKIKEKLNKYPNHTIRFDFPNNSANSDLQIITATLVTTKTIRKSIDINNEVCIKKGGSESKGNFTNNLLGNENKITLNYDDKNWKDIIQEFSTEYKKESLKLVKKNDLIDKYEVDYQKPTLTNIFDIKHKIIILNKFQEAIINIDEKNGVKREKNGEERKKRVINPFAELIFASKIIYYFMMTYMALKSLGKVIKYFAGVIISLILFSLILFSIDFFNFFTSSDNATQSFIVLVRHYDLLIFIIGASIFALIAPLSSIFATSLKLKSIDIHKDTKHDSWEVFVKNLSYYSFTFFVAVIIMIASIALLSSSGLEYNKAFHFLSNLLFPTLQLGDIPKFFIQVFDTDVIFGIFVVKIFFLMFLFSLIVLFIQQSIEMYTELVDNTQSKKYSIPPEFIRFFSYLMLSIFTIILFYGALFINYPNLSAEYNTCKNYLDDNYKTRKNCVNALDKNFTTDNEVIYNLLKNSKIIDKKSIVYNSKSMKDTNKSIKQLISYCSNLSSINESNISLCPIAMSIEEDKDIFRSNAVLSSPVRSLSDYLPLSIFLALFGTVIMLATRNLLENYFSGLSLKFLMYPMKRERESQ